MPMALIPLRTHLHKIPSGLFTLAGNNDQDMLMLVLRPGISCYDNLVQLGATDETVTRVPWAIGVDEFVAPQYIDADLNEICLV